MSDALLAKWADERRSLTEEEASELLRILESDPELARQAKEQLLADDLLSRRLASDRARFENQVAQRLVAAGHDEPFLVSTLDAVGRLERRRSAIRRWSLEVAAALVLVAGLFFFVIRREPSGIPARAPDLQPGLRAEYFAQRQLQGTPIVRTDTAIDFTWAAGGGPLPGAGDVYSARWTGKLRARVGGRHTFRVRNDDGFRLWVDGALVIDDWNARLFVAENRGSIELEAGKIYDFRAEYYNGGDRGVAQLFWSAPGLADELVPPAQFSHR